MDFRKNSSVVVRVIELTISRVINKMVKINDGAIEGRRVH